MFKNKSLSFIFLNISFRRFFRIFQGSKSKKNKKKYFLNLSKSLLNYFLVIFLISLILFSIFVLSSCKKGKEDAEKKDKSLETAFGPIYDVGELIVNLADLGQARYAKFQIVLELKDEPTLGIVNTRSPQVKDIVINIFSSKKAEEILDLEIRDQIKKEIINKINSIIGEGSVKNAYFTTIVVQ